jgi:AAHS family 4-hydroxybenzoate transporter-like MFS transporter
MDVGRLLDYGPWSTAQRRVLALMALTIMFDGFDLLVLSFAIPALMKEWGVGRGGLATVLAVGLVAMSVGTAVAGYLGDRLGRKKALVLSVLVFGAATLASAFAWDLASLGVLRAVAGAGLGGAVPNAAAMSAEFTPLRRRPLAVSLTAVCIPLGGALAGFSAARILPVYGWACLFALGGVGALGLALVLATALPESPRFLVRRRERWTELRGLLLQMGHAAPEEAEFSDVAETAREKRGGWAALFGPAIVRDTVCLFVCFLSGMLAIYLALNWLPTLLASKGWDLSRTSAGLAAYNFGGVAGALICALLVPRWGSRVAMLTACGCAVASAGYLYTGAFGLTALAAHGLFANAVQSNLFSLAAHVYPTATRAFGVASAIALGRMGAVASAFLGAGLVQQGAAAYFLAIALALVVTFAGLGLLRDHIPALDIRRVRNE